MATKAGVYLCRCGGILSEKLDFHALEQQLASESGVGYVRTVELACSEDGRGEIAEDLRRRQPERVVVAACSPRDHEETFRDVLLRAGMNPFLVQLANVREQAAWVTADGGLATAKALALVRAALARVAVHEPLEPAFLEVSTDVLVIGAGPAGLQAAITLAEADRRVVLVEASPIVGGLPVRCEDLFPKLECAPCVLEPVIAEILHGPLASRIELLLLSEVESLIGSFGNFLVTIHRRPRFVDAGVCMGCGACVEACQATLPNATNFGRSQRKAMDYVFFGGLPNAPHILPAGCLRSAGEECDRCRAACPIEGAVRLDDRDERIERRVGAIVVAIGGAVYAGLQLSQYGYGLPDVVTSLELERLLAANGPTQGEVRLANGRLPESIAIVHCAGSLDPRHKDYCSGICCLNAFKFNVLFGKKLPEARVTHYVRTLVAPGKDESDFMRQALTREKTRVVTYAATKPVRVEAADGGRKRITLEHHREAHDLVVLMPPVVPSPGAAGLAERLGLGTDRHGFLEERHGRVDPTRSRVRGIYLAGSCRAPMDVGRATTEGASAAGLALSALVPGRRLELEAIHAAVDEERCSGCRTCLGVCPYRAIGIEPERRRARVDPALCEGCGTCAAACPSSAMRARHFTNAQLFAEIAGALR